MAPRLACRAFRQAVAAAVLCAGAASPLRGQLSLETQSQYKQAEALVRAGQWDQGLAVLLPLAKANPDNPRILNLTGLALTGQNKPKEADEYFLQCLKVSPGFFAALKNLGINEYRIGQTTEAEEHLTAALHQAPNDKVVHLYLGQLAFDRRDFARSSEQLTLAGDLVLRDPNVTAQLAAAELQAGEPEKGFALLDQVPPSKLSGTLQFALGLALVQASHSNQALPYLEAAHGRAPLADDLNFDLAVVYLGLKKFEQAISAAKVLIANGHETSETDNLLAEAYEGDKQTQAAIDSLRRAIALDPSAEQNYLDFASLCLNHQAYSDGLKVLTVGMGVVPRSDRLVFERGILYAMQDHFDLAEKDFERASTLAPAKDLGTLGLGITYLETGNSKEAVTLLRKRLRETPNDPQLLYLLGEALLRSGALPGDPAYAEAQKALEASVSGNPSFGLAHVALGAIYLSEDRNAEAVAQLEQARSLKPNERSIYSHLAIAYRRLGKTAEAKLALIALQTINDRDRDAVTARMKLGDTFPKR